MLEEKVGKFIAEYYKVNYDEAKEVIDNKESLFLLLIWGIFEQTHFPGRKPSFIEKLKTIEYNFKNDDCYNDFRHIALSFHATFQDNGRWENLDSGILSENKNYDLFIDIQGKKAKDLSNIEIIKFGLFVVSRYRNNIFHGLKDANDQHNKYKKEIEDCVNLLIAYLKGVK